MNRCGERDLVWSPDSRLPIAVELREPEVFFGDLAMVFSYTDSGRIAYSFSGSGCARNMVAVFVSRVLGPCLTGTAIASLLGMYPTYPAIPCPARKDMRLLFPEVRGPRWKVDMAACRGLCRDLPPSTRILNFCGTTDFGTTLLDLVRNGCGQLRAWCDTHKFLVPMSSNGWYTRTQAFSEEWNLCTTVPWR
eukprot:3449649-Rhodomonas_salina.1